MNGINDVIRQLESQKAAIEKALEALRAVAGGEVSGGAAPSAPVVSPNNKRSAAQKARWAAKRAAEPSTPAKATRKGGMTAKGRRRLAEAMKRRWAAKRTATQVTERGPKKAPRKTA